jgi:hypothetical protein
MYDTDFDYTVSDKKTYHVYASCNNIVTRQCFGLTLKFTDHEGSIIKLDYDPDMFKDVTKQAVERLLYTYYNWGISL